jgi:hypothetical protein
MKILILDSPTDILRNTRSIIATLDAGLPLVQEAASRADSRTTMHQVEAGLAGSAYRLYRGRLSKRGDGEVPGPAARLAGTESLRPAAG